MDKPSLLNCIILLLVLPGSSSDCSPTERPFSCRYYYDQLEDLLLNHDAEIFWLQRSFFPARHSSPSVMKMNIYITVGTIPSQNCTTGALPAFYSSSYSKEWKGEWGFILSDSAILLHVHPVLLFVFENTILWGLYAVATGLGADESYQSSLHFYIDKLPCIPSSDIMTEALTFLLTWAKAYAKYQTKPTEWNQNERMYVTAGYMLSASGNPIIVLQPSKESEILLIIAFVFLSILVALSLSLLSAEYYPRLLHSGDYAVWSLYWSAAYVSTGLNILQCGIFVIALILQHPPLGTCQSNVLTCDDELVKTASITKGITVLVVLSLNIFASVRTTWKSINSSNRIPFRWCSCSSCKKHKECMVQAILLSSILIFLQTASMAIIPASILMFVYPSQIISAFALITSSIFCITVLLAHMLHFEVRTTSRFKLAIQACIMLFFLGLVGVLIAFYLMLLSQGFTGGIHEFLLLLLPSAIVSVVGYFLRRKIPKDNKETQSARAFTIIGNANT